MKQDKNLETVKVHKNSSLPYSEICDSKETESPHAESFFDGDVEILMGEGICFLKMLFQRLDRFVYFRILP